MYIGNPSFKETRFKKRFGLLGIDFMHYTVFDGKDDILDYHKDIPAEYDALKEMPDINGWLGYVYTPAAALSEEHFDRLADASIFHFFSENATDVTFVFDWSDVELIEGEELQVAEINEEI